MTRIEINLKEYNELKDSIKTLEKKQMIYDEIIMKHQNDKHELIEELNDLVNETGFFNRVFQWKKITKNAQEILKKYEDK